MNLDLVSIGRKVKNARIKARISQAELASRAGVSRATIIALENGTLKEIGINRLSGITRVADSLIPASPPVVNLGRAKSKSGDLNLSFPYDWSNPDLKDEVLIAKVIERGLFEDIVRVVGKYGIKKVGQAATTFAAKHPYAAPSLNRMMSSISRVVHDA